MYALDILIDFTSLLKLNLREVKPICNWSLDSGLEGHRWWGWEGGYLPSSQWALEHHRAAVSAPNSLPCTHTTDCVSTQDSATILALISRGLLQENKKCHPVLWGGKEPQPQHRKNPPKGNDSRLQEEPCPLQPVAIKGAEVGKADNR